ncbi:MFS transporter [Novosphingobium sp. PhB165]|uniref:MFS transporter n=1 Tax=Novosphingobium sp. PhB165 TaxID=2485105 RepID=UPI00104F4EF0|nr:MFS transporter [Novosphingobium sp. PhB165]TCM16576.1 MFS transporter [Novosphingobium sp. PhB165]
MTYLAELKSNWRPLLAATIGVGTGMSLAGTITSAIAPSMIAANGWSKADFALVGSLGIVSSLAFPFVGRIADVLGVRLTALIGQVALPLVYLAYSLMSGSLRSYIVIFLVQSVICLTTTATVYSRLPVQCISVARGAALAIVASGPALVSAIGGPILNDYVEAHGWRAAYQMLAIFAAMAGTITFLLIPPEVDREAIVGAPRRRAREDYPIIFNAPAFWILLAAMLLCNLPQVIMLTQLKLVLLDNGVTGRGASVMISALSIGMLTGRLLTGLALDRFNPFVISFITLALPSLGLFIIASSFDAPAVLTTAVFFLGFAFGAEGDIIAFLVALCFPMRIYGSVMGLMTAVMSASAALGAALLSLTLARTGGFNMFLVISGTAVLAGATLLMTLSRAPRPLEREACAL